MEHRARVGREGRPPRPLGSLSGLDQLRAPAPPGRARPRGATRPRRPERPTRPPGGARRTQGPAPRRDRGTARHPPGDRAAAPRPPREQAEHGQREEETIRLRPGTNTERRPLRITCGNGRRRGGRASASTTRASRQRQAPSPTGRPRRAPPDDRMRARPRIPTAPTSPLPVRHARPAPGSDPRERFDERSSTSDSLRRPVSRTAENRPSARTDVTPCRQAATTGDWRLERAPLPHPRHDRH